jgi:hypothetical protein
MKTMLTLLPDIAVVVGIGLQVVILVLLLRRRLQSRFLWFLAYIAYEIVESLLRLVVVASFGEGSRLYLKVYWSTEILEVILCVMAVRESFLNVFRGYTRIRLFMWSVWSCVGLALLYSVFKAWFFPPLHAGWRATAVIDLELGVEYCLAAVGLLYFGLQWFLKMRGRNWESGVISGFSIYVGLALCGYLTRSIFGTRFSLVSVWLPTVAYLVGEVTWVFEFSRREVHLASLRPLTIDDEKRLEQDSKTLERLEQFLRGKR